MTGARGGVIGVKKEDSIAHLRSRMPVRYDTATDDPWLNAVLVRCATGRGRRPRSSRCCGRCRSGAAARRRRAAGSRRGRGRTSARRRAGPRAGPRRQGRSGRRGRPAPPRARGRPTADLGGELQRCRGRRGPRAQNGESRSAWKRTARSPEVAEAAVGDHDQHQRTGEDDHRPEQRPAGADEQRQQRQRRQLGHRRRRGQGAAAGGDRGQDERAGEGVVGARVGRVEGERERQPQVGEQQSVLRRAPAADQVEPRQRRRDRTSPPRRGRRAGRPTTRARATPARTGRRRGRRAARRCRRGGCRPGTSRRCRAGGRACRRRSSPRSRRRSRSS